VLITDVRSEAEVDARHVAAAELLDGDGVTHDAVHATSIQPGERHPHRYHRAGD
jgi:hypothetical protein